MIVLLVVGETSHFVVFFSLFVSFWKAPLQFSLCFHVRSTKKLDFDTNFSSLQQKNKLWKRHTLSLLAPYTTLQTPGKNLQPFIKQHTTTVLVGGLALVLLVVLLCLLGDV